VLLAVEATQRRRSSSLKTYGGDGGEQKKKGRGGLADDPTRNFKFRASNALSSQEGVTIKGVTFLLALPPVERGERRARAFKKTFVYGGGGYERKQQQRE